jgi:TMEM175 potassium channel family protein
VAATLLVVELAVPESDFDHLWKGIAHQWPSYLGFTTSFLTVGGIWFVHHAIFRHLRFADFNINRLNLLLLLMAIAFLPFPTKLVAEAINSSGEERTAVIFYGATLLVISLLMTAIRSLTPHEAPATRGFRVARGRIAITPRAAPARDGHTRVATASGS